MDPFADERPELTGSLISMEFGQGGRITQLWASDPALPDEGEEFQFVLPPLAFGEESAEDYYPGTFLIGARTNPDEPWISVRNGAARQVFEGDDAEDSPFEQDNVVFQYDLPLLPELEATGRFYEIAGVIPQVAWDLEIRNGGRVSVEIGELGFPLALNCFYDGFGWSDEQLRRLWTSRLYVHKFIGGAASWLFAQRMTAEPPGLLIFPGDETGWEFCCHVPASLNTPHQWEGIPVVYVYSKATVEREGWGPWWNDHRSLILEPGDRRKVQMRFVPTERDKQDGVFQTLASCGRPAIRLLPSAVAPIDVGIAVEVAGTSPSRFYVSREAAVETDTDEEGGFCFVRPKEPGPLRLTFEDQDGRLSHAHLLFTEPIEVLIKRRAAWIAAHQVLRKPDSVLDQAILLTDIARGQPVTDPEEYAGASGIECSLADALFLAEKNAIYPEPGEVQTLNRYVADFLQDDVQNPGDLAVASVLGDGSGLGSYAGRPLTYPHVYNLYHSMYRIASTGAATEKPPRAYLEASARTAIAMFRHGWRHYVRTVGLLGYARVYDILADLRSEGMAELHNRLFALIDDKARELIKQQYPYAGESVLDTSGFEEVFAAALHLSNDEHLERTQRCAFAARSLAPNWWWYGSDKRSWDGADSTPRRALIDRGEACLAHTTIPNSLIFFAGLDKDYLAIADAHMRLAFGGMMGPWALVRPDGAASMCYCPDPSSKHYGFNPYTGASGLGYFHYLRGAGSYVLPNREQGTLTFGCHFEQDDKRYLIRPWDGVGRRVVMRQIGASFELTFGRIVEMEMDVRKRWVTVQVQNPIPSDARALLRCQGLWGRRLEVAVEGAGGRVNIDCVDGVAEAPLTLPGAKIVKVSVRVVQ
jgi:hypothetical protein